VPLFSRGFVRRRAISLATSLSVMATSFALAQVPKHDPEARTVKDKDEQQFLFDSNLAMSNMNRGMLMAPTGGIDRDLVDVMVPHHQGAINMARAEMRYGHNDELRLLAGRNVNQPEQEISIMQHALPTIVSAMPSSRSDTARHAAN
jgi:uncharacterized protein (DUF305 family)